MDQVEKDEIAKEAGVRDRIVELVGILLRHPKPLVDRGTKDTTARSNGLSFHLDITPTTTFHVVCNRSGQLVGPTGIVETVQKVLASLGQSTNLIPQLIPTTFEALLDTASGRTKRLGGIGYVTSGKASVANSSGREPSCKVTSMRGHDVGKVSNALSRASFLFMGVIHLNGSRHAIDMRQWA